MSIITAFPPIEVDELLIRFPQESDADKILAYFKKNRDFLAPWEPKRPESFYTFSGWQYRLTQLAKLQEHKLAFYFLIFAKAKPDTMLGFITFSNISFFPAYSADVGYSLAKDAQSKGIMTRTLTASCQFLFDEINLHRIHAAYMPKNKRSAKVLEAAGFIAEGEAKDYLLINGRWEDHILTSLVNPNWPSAKI